MSNINIDKILALQNGEIKGVPLDTTLTTITVDCFTDTDLVVGLQAWAETKNDFDTDFIDKMAENLENEKQLTDRQRIALENIVAKFDIKIEDFL